MISLSPRHVQSVLSMRGEEGREWLERLPALVEECARAWSLTLAGAYQGIWYNYVAPGVAAHGEPVVLKVCFPDREFFTEAEALRLLDGQGINRLLAADLSRGALLLERLVPGTSLNDLRDDRQATSIAAQVMRALWRPAPEGDLFPSVDEWVRHMDERKARLLPGSGFPPAWVERALTVHRELASEPAPHVLLHGDLHHGNILRATRAPWLAIDPKGVTGEALCETGPLLINALPEPLDLAGARRALGRRTHQLADELEVDHARLVAWGVVRAVLSAFWSLEDRSSGWAEALLVAEALS